MPYILHNFHLTEKQIESLANGNTIKLKHSQLHGSYPVALTMTQKRKVIKSHGNNKGLNLRLSPAQLNYHIKHGGGIFSDVFNRLKTYGRRAANYLQPYAEPALNRVKDLAVQRASNIAKRAINQAENYTESKINDYSNRINNRLGELQAPGGPRVGLHAEPLRGDGFFSDALGSIGKAILPIATNLATNAIQKRLGGELRKKRYGVNPNHKGGSFVLPGGVY